MCLTLRQMNPKAVALSLTGLLMAACGGSESQPGTATIDPAATPSPTVHVDLSEEAFPDLIYWEGYVGWDYEPSRTQVELVRRAGESRDKTYLPYLLDLVSVPTPYREAVLPELSTWLGAEGDRSLINWLTEQGPKTADDDSLAYRQFKQRLFRTIQKEIGDFLDPDSDRLISAQEIAWGGVCVDCIPPLEQPAFVTPLEAKQWIAASDPVVGVEINGDVRAYPQRIIAWHEMVNDVIGGVPVSLAYCTLCQSAILYETTVGDTVFDFGTSGMLYRSNKLMYDRQTRSLWEQWTGEPVWGELVGSGIDLTILPVVYTTWGEWLAEHPETMVLSINTGFTRDYGSGIAYGDYFDSNDVIFPIPYDMGALAPKHWVYAVRHNGDTIAFRIDHLAEAGFAEETVGGTEIVAFTSSDGIGARAYERRDVAFVTFDPGKGTATSSDGRDWQLSEAAMTADDGETLPRLAGHNAYFFAVSNHAPNWRLWTAE